MVVPLAHRLLNWKETQLSIYYTAGAAQVSTVAINIAKNN